MGNNAAGIPPNGFQGAAQQTAAVRNHLAAHTSKALGHTKSVRRKRKTKAKTSTRSSRPRAKKSAGAVILKAGTAAAKAWGRKMQAARKKAAKKAA